MLGHAFVSSSNTTDSPELVVNRLWRAEVALACRCCGQSAASVSFPHYPLSFSRALRGVICRQARAHSLLSHPVGVNKWNARVGRLLRQRVHSLVRANCGACGDLPGEGETLQIIEQRPGNCELSRLRPQ
jgi:hypothetical protein